VDVYHARQHLWELARKLHPNERPTRTDGSWYIQIVAGNAS
jgi:hypothetical protein